MKYQKREFCCGKDLKQGRWLILGNMQRELYTFRAHFDNSLFFMTRIKRIPKNLNSHRTKHFWNEAFHEYAMILISAFVRIGMESLFYFKVFPRPPLESLSSNDWICFMIWGDLLAQNETINRLIKQNIFCFIHLSTFH